MCIRDRDFSGALADVLEAVVAGEAVGDIAGVSGVVEGRDELGDGGVADVEKLVGGGGQ